MRIELRTLKPLLQQCDRPRVEIDRHAKGLRHGIGRDVVVSWPDTPGGEHIAIAMPQRI
jgi:hypothetical protein